MKDNWPPERREYYAELIVKRRPWERSTGPRTDEGKEACKKNAEKHGLRGAQWQMLNRVLRLQEKALK